MRSAAVLALLLCAGQVSALPVNSPVNKRDIEVMKCIVEVISDTLAKPSPVPVSQECFETLRGDERILSILRHQNLLKELQDLALQGAKERAQQQKKHSSFEEELSEVLEQQNEQEGPKEGTEEVPSKEAAEDTRDSSEMERNGGDADGAGPLASLEPGQGSTLEEDDQAPGEEEAANSHPPASRPSQKYPGPQAEGDSEGPSQGLVDREKGLGAEQGKQAKREEEEEDPEAGEVVSEEEGPTTASDAHPSLGYKEVPRGQSKAPAVDGGGKTGAEETQKGEQEQSLQEEEEEEEMAGSPLGPFRGGKSREQEQEQEERFSKEWEEAKRWSKMDQLARELTAEKRLAGEDVEDDDPDRSMQLPYQARGYGFRGPGMRGWRPSPQEDTVEAGLPLRGRGYPEEKKEEEGSANRRPEDQELESLSAIEAELEKVAHQLQALRRG
ncbi:chromogranin-A isoform X2 [Sturnira hondurensis]|uniref:chromogranin-A isoform X2 n=1 Tax=Sturnira hondurensis TaxID=192404 RepID=UPI0018799DB2|nr:chromogranin-A isoform X2 [Sturnira hondurensis]